MRFTLSNGKRVTIVAEELDGIWLPDRLQISVRASLRGKPTLETLIHELLHAELHQLPERDVFRVAKSITRFCAPAAKAGKETQMKTLLIGRGHLGTFLKSRLNVPDNMHYTGELADVVVPPCTDMVVNTAGKTSLEWCEANPAEAFRCNVIAPLIAFRVFKAVCLQKYSMFVHISSGCVWDGPFPRIGLGFTPNDPVVPACFYSWTKACCDALLLRESAGWNLAILRPRQVYSPIDSPRNTLTKLLRYPKLIDTANSMTSAETIARTIERLIEYPAHVKGGRIVNVYDIGTTTPYDVGCMLSDAGLRFKPEKISKNTLDETLKPRRVDTVLEDMWFEDLVKPPSIVGELRRVIKEFKENCK